LVDELLAAELLARLREIGLSNLAFWMIQFLRSLMSAQPSLYLAMRMSNVALGHCYGLLLSFFCHCPSFGLFGLIILGGCSSPMTTSLALVNSVYDGRTRTFFLSSSTMFMFAGNGSLSSFILGLSANFNRPSFIAD
jgi:hypothetical protein